MLKVAVDVSGFGKQGYYSFQLMGYKSLCLGDVQNWVAHPLLPSKDTGDLINSNTMSIGLFRPLLHV